MYYILAYYVYNMLF